MLLLEVRRGVLGGELQESGQRVQTSRAPPSRALPASAPNPDLEGALGPKHSLRALHRPTSAESRKHRGAPGEPSSRRRLAGPCPGASSRPWARRKHALLQVIRALQKGTRLLLRKTPFCRLQLSQPTSIPVPSPAPRNCLFLSHRRDQESRARCLKAPWS